MYALHCARARSHHYLYRSIDSHRLSYCTTRRRLKAAMEKVREEDVLSVAVRMVLGLCCACLGCVNEEGTRRSERRPCPKVAFEPNRDGRWTTSSSAQARQTVGWSKVGSIRASFDPRDKGQWSTRKAGERTKKGEARVLLSQRLASALSEVESRDAREELLPKADTR